MKNTENKSRIYKSHQEEILVIARETLFKNEKPWHGLSTENIQSTIDTISKHQEYKPRYLAENDFSYKQIIPYMVFTFDDKFFVMQRKSTASEQRLANKLSIGIGGHMREEDISGKTIFDWAKREFEEEVSYSGNLTISTIGILNDDSNDVGKVHLGLVLLLKGDNDQISIKDEHKNGLMFSKKMCQEKINHMESWSQLVLQSIL